MIAQRYLALIATPCSASILISFDYLLDRLASSIRIHVFDSLRMIYHMDVPSCSVELDAMHFAKNRRPLSRNISAVDEYVAFQAPTRGDLRLHIGDATY